MQEIKVVIGGNFGDEGKGLMTDYFAAEAENSGRKTLVICSNGGAQRGHTVVTPSGIRHVFHHFGSGALAGADTWLPRFFIVNPMIFMNEIEELAGKGVKFETSGMMGQKIFMDPECPVTTPFDMITNQILEENRGGNRHGSCGVGIWETLLRDGLLLGEMADLPDSELYKYLDRECREQLKRRLETSGIHEIPEKWKDIIYSEDLLRNYIEDFREMCRIAEFRSVEVMKAYDRLIFEAGQGLLLDRCRREYGCHTTPSNTGLRNPAELIREYLNISPGCPGVPQGNMDLVRFPGKTDVEVCFVTRTYLTRHGAGPFREECGKDEINPDMTDLTNVPNPHQGTLRYGKLDIGTFLRRIREDFDSERFPQDCNARMTWAVTHVNEYMPIGMRDRKPDYSSDGETYFSVRKMSGKDGDVIPDRRPA